MIYRKRMVIVEGHISGYFGGKAVSASTSPATPWRWFFMVAGVTALIQTSLIIYRKLKSRRLTTQQRLVVTLADNLVNVNGMKTFFLGCIFLTVVGVANQLMWRLGGKEVDYNIELFPKSLMTYSFGLLFFQLRPFFINQALRFVKHTQLQGSFHKSQSNFTLSDHIQKRSFDKFCSETTGIGV